jgi:putative transposase
MPDHLHMLMTPAESVEKSVQLIKGGFSFRAKRELEWTGEIWQPGFTDHRIRDEEDWLRHLGYIRQNPVDAKLVEESVLYEFMGMASIAFPRGLKPAEIGVIDDVRAKARTLQAEARTLQAEARTLQSDASLTSGGTAEAVPFQSQQSSAMSPEISAIKEVEEYNAT